MNGGGNLPVAGPVVSGADGYARFGSLPAGSFQVLVFGGPAWELVALPARWDWQGKSGSDAGLTLAPPIDKTPPCQSPLLVEVRRLSPVAGLPRIAGTVVDASTGRPLEQAFVSLSPYLTAYEGKTQPSDDVTLGDGAFAVWDIPFAPHPITEELFQVVPLLITRHGYRPRAWSYEHPPGDIQLDISGVVIELTPIDPGDSGVISGRLWRGGAPAAGVVVGLGYVDAPQDKDSGIPSELDGAEPTSGPGLTGRTGLTDEQGEFRITGLPAGRYVLHPGFLLYDGFFFSDQPAAVPHTVLTGQETAAGDLLVLHEIEPLFPYAGMSMSEVPPELIWTPVPDAAGYLVQLDQQEFSVIGASSFTLPGDLTLEPGSHWWGVVAVDEQENPVGSTQVPAVFKVAAQPD
jgi:hypothetical protein